ncbi:MAG TPA: EAL domain-containing protein [Planctomycetota bacterium]|nr:EAL domain-containing protein [Planctomycetota bacterium]
MTTTTRAAIPKFDSPPLRRYSDHLFADESHVEARFQNYCVRSAYQPIFSFAHGRPVGFEGLARTQSATGVPMSPGELFGSASDLESTVFLDRLLRTLHLANFSDPAYRTAWLFLNISPTAVVNGRAFGPFFKEMLHAFSMPPQRVVVEITEHETPDERVLEEATQYYKEIGCLVAIDDFGAGHSNFNRIWRLKPDIIKLDRHMIFQAAQDSAARRGLVGIAGLLHELGALVLAEGIETEEEARVVVHAEVDLLQGYFFQRPYVGPPPRLEHQERFDTLRRSLFQQAKDDEDEFQHSVRAYREAFSRAGDALSAGHALPVAVREILSLPTVIRCYLLGADGSQIGDNLAAPDYVSRRDPRHQPLNTGGGANWMHRHYFRRAVSNPSHIQISRPYLSLTDPRMCLTLSRAIRRGSDLVVLCCDLEYPVVPPRTARGGDPPRPTG